LRQRKHFKLEEGSNRHPSNSCFSKRRGERREGKIRERVIEKEKNGNHDDAFFKGICVKREMEGKEGKGAQVQWLSASPGPRPKGVPQFPPKKTQTRFVGGGGKREKANRGGGE